MLRASNLLNQFFGQSQAPDANPQVGQAPAPQGSGGFNFQSLLSGPGGLATGAVAGGLAGLLIGGAKPKKVAENALKYGGAAVVGGLAYKAWRDWQSNKAPAAPVEPGASAAPASALPPPQGTPFAPSEPDEQEDLSRSILRAMIAAAKADGHIDEDERHRIAARLDTVHLDSEQQAFVEAELASPLDIDQVARGARNREQAAEIYAASLLVIDRHGPVERGYLAMLAARLRLEPGLVDHLHANADQVLDAVPA